MTGNNERAGTQAGDRTGKPKRVGQLADVLILHLHQAAGAVEGQFEKDLVEHGDAGGRRGDKDQRGRHRR